MVLYELNIWYFLICVGLDILIVVISWPVWKENNNKEYSDYNFEKINSMISIEDMDEDKRN